MTENSKVEIEKRNPFPEPLHNLIVVANPIKNVSEMTQQLEKLPTKDREIYIRTTLASKFEEMEVLAVGPDVRDIKVGDFLATTISNADRAVSLTDNKYLYLSPRDFIAKW